MSRLLHPVQLRLMRDSKLDNCPEIKKAAMNGSAAVIPTTLLATLSAQKNRKLKFGK